jgi:hypothetical protein
MSSGGLVKVRMLLANDRVRFCQGLKEMPRPVRLSHSRAG